MSYILFSVVINQLNNFSLGLNFKIPNTCQNKNTALIKVKF